MDDKCQIQKKLKRSDLFKVPETDILGKCTGLGVKGRGIKDTQNKQ